MNVAQTTMMRDAWARGARRHRTRLDVRTARRAAPGPRRERVGGGGGGWALSERWSCVPGTVTVSRTSSSSLAPRTRRASTLDHHEAARQGPPLHVHPGEDDAFYILEGNIVMIVEDEEIVVGPGNGAVAFSIAPAFPLRSRTARSRWHASSTKVHGAGGIRPASRGGLTRPLHPEARGMLEPARGGSAIRRWSPRRQRRCARCARGGSSRPLWRRRRGRDRSAALPAEHRGAARPVSLLPRRRMGASASIETHDHGSRALARRARACLGRLPARAGAPVPGRARRRHSAGRGLDTRGNAPSLGCDPGSGWRSRHPRAQTSQPSSHRAGTVPVPLPAARLPGDRRTGRYTLNSGSFAEGFGASEGRHALVLEHYLLGQRGRAEQTAGLTSARRRLGIRGRPLEHSSLPPSSIRCATRARRLSPTGSAQRRCAAETTGYDGMMPAGSSRWASSCRTDGGA